MDKQEFHLSKTEVDKLFEMGLSVIPFKGYGEKPKMPAIDWKPYQNERMGTADFWKLQFKNSFQWVGVVCGRISGNLEIIDVDVKHKAEADIFLLSEIKNRLPHINFRTHRTPSNGTHILYRISDPPPIFPGWTKLAFSTSGCFIETRSEANVSIMPPSTGYTVINNVPIPVITWLERLELMIICKGFTEVAEDLPEEREKKVAKYEKNYYAVSPWEAYNDSQEAEEILLKYNWKIQKRSNKEIYFTRPGGSGKGANAVYYRKERLYWIITDKSELYGDRVYKPGSIRLQLEFGGDWDAMKKALFEEGRHRYQPQVIRQIKQKSILSDLPIQPGLSPADIQEIETARDKLKERYPHGIFIGTNEKGKVIIVRELFERVATAMGFRYHRQEIVRITGNKIYKIEDDIEFYKLMKGYINEETDTAYINISSLLDEFLQGTGKWKISMLPALDESKILKSDKDICYKFYANHVVVLRKGKNPTREPYESFTENLFWAHAIQNRNEAAKEGGRYDEFFSLALGKSDYNLRILGRLADDFKTPANSYAIVPTEQCENPEEGGGSGKNVFCELLKLTTSYMSTPADQLTFDDKFMGPWGGQRVWCLSDLPKKFPFMFLKEPITGDGSYRKLYKDAVVVPSCDMPIFILPTNYSFDNLAYSLKRRLIPLEFTDFFTRAGGVDTHFNGCYFPDHWDAEDYAGFDFLVLKGLQLWLDDNRKLSPADLSTGGWKKQFDGKFPHCRKFFEEYMEIWIGADEPATFPGGRVPAADFKRIVDEYALNNGLPKSFTLIQVNKALDEYCKYYPVSCTEKQDRKFFNKKRYKEFFAVIQNT